jgi:hypothetical protein
MRLRLTLIILLLQVMPACSQIQQNTFQVTPDGPNNLSLTVASYYPLRDALDYLDHEYGWRISYEDPVYPDGELTDIAIPEWKKKHPGERGFFVPKFTEMRFRISKPTGGRGEAKKVLTELIEEFNQSGRLEKFSVLDASDDRHVVVGTINGAGALDHAVLGPEPKPRNGSTELLQLTQRCGSQMPLPITVGTVSANMLQQITVPPRKTNEPCRDALLALTALGGFDIVYQMLEDVNNKTFVMNIVRNRIVTAPTK